MAKTRPLEDRFQLTHIVPRRPETDAWVLLTFYTKTNEGYHIGFARHNYTSKEMEEMESDGVVQELKDKPQISPSGNKLVWITPKKQIYLADEHDPINDSDKMLLSTEENRRKSGKMVQNKKIL